MTTEELRHGKSPFSRPNLDQLRHQSKDLLHAIHRGDPDAIVYLRELYSKSIDPAESVMDILSGC
jgi:hypothetical protein